MTTSEAIVVCKTLADKVGSPSIEDYEWLNHLNMAQNDVLNSMIPDSLGGVVNFEMDENTSSNIQPLIYSLSVTPSSNVLTLTAINTALMAASGDSGCEVFRILNMSQGNTLFRFTKHNNVFTFKQNSFKTPDASNPRYTLISSGYKLYPDTILSTTITVIKTPRIMTTGNSPDWDNYMMNQVIGRAVKLAAVGIHDEEIIVNLRNSGVQSTQ